MELVLEMEMVGFAKYVHFLCSKPFSRVYFCAKWYFGPNNRKRIAGDVYECDGALLDWCEAPLLALQLILVDII